MYALHVFSNVFKSNHTYNTDFVHCVKLLLAIYSVEISLVSITSVNDVGKRFTSVAWHPTKQWHVIRNRLNQSFIPFSNNHFLNQSIALLEAMDIEMYVSFNRIFLVVIEYGMMNDCLCVLVIFYIFSLFTSIFLSLRLKRAFVSKQSTIL